MTNTIGILGGGQLGRMLCVAAAKLGYRTHIFEPQPNPPAAQVASTTTTAAYSDAAALADFAASVDVITYEFENIPLAALAPLSAIRPIFPPLKALEISQDRLNEKQFLTGIGLEVAPYAPVNSAADLTKALESIGTPAILKTRRMGYDGKGQVRITSADLAASAVEQIASPAVLEGFVHFEREISIIAARGVSGEIVCFDPVENIHKNGILHTSTVPADLSLAQQTDAIILAGKILNALDYVGVLAVELFVTPDGLVVNEIAPRVHNSGHWTQDACLIDQFEQHIRAIASQPLGDGHRHSNAVMTNLIGSDPVDFTGQTSLHLYGKAESRPGRKMGHYTKISPISG